MSFFTSIIKGIAIGAGAILPGISSGVLCVIFGIYEKLVDSVLGIFQDFKKNFKFLFPIAIGSAIGFFLFGNILNYMFGNFESECKLLFLGLILGSFPSLLKQVNMNKSFRLHYLIYSIFSFLLGLFLFFLEDNLSNNYIFYKDSLFYLILSGFAMSAGIIIPGVSSTVILMCFGVYYTYLEAISVFNLSVLIPMGIGVIGGSIFFLILIHFLLKNYHSQTFYCIIGFVIGSIFVLLPNHFSLFSLFFFVVGFIIALNFKK